MPEFFVWSLPSLVEIVEAASEKDVAEAFLERPVTQAPDPSKPPACFVQPTAVLEIPKTDGSSIEFWIDDGVDS